MTIAWSNAWEMLFGATARSRHHQRRHAELREAHDTFMAATGSGVHDASASPSLTDDLSSASNGRVRRRDPSFDDVRRNFQHIPSVLADLEFYFALTGLGLLDHLLGVLLLPLKVLFRRRNCELRDAVTLVVLAACLGGYAVVGAVTTQLYSYLYHAVRRTSFVKLVMIFGIVDAADKILASLSQDALEVFYACIDDECVYRSHRDCGAFPTASRSDDSGGTRLAAGHHSGRVRRLSLSQMSQHSNDVLMGGEKSASLRGAAPPPPVSSSRRHTPLRPPSRWLLAGSGLAACVGTSLHSLSLLLHVVTLNVAINAEGNALLALLIGNNFSELKSVVFKKNTAESLHAVCVLDALERMQYVVFFLVMLLHHTHERFSDFALADVLVILLVEVVIDFVKHLFVSKFNGIPPSVFRSYAQLTLLDLSAETVLWRLPKLTVTVASTSSRDGAGREAEAPEAAEMLTPSSGFAPRHVKRAGFDAIAYAALLLWSSGRAGGYLVAQAPLIGGLLVGTVVLLKLTLSSILYGVCARFTLRTLVAVPPTWAAPSSFPTATNTTAAAGRPLDASWSVRLGVSPIGTPRAAPASSWSTIPLPTAGSGERGSGGGAAHTVVRLTPILVALLKVDRFDLQAGKAKRVY